MQNVTVVVSNNLEIGVISSTLREYAAEAEAKIDQNKSVDLQLSTW